MVIEKNNLFAQEAFSDLEPDDIAWLNEKATTRTLDKDEFVFYPGDLSQSVYFINKGRIKLGSYNPDGKEMIKHVFFENDFFGIMAISNQKKRANYAKAMDPDTEIVVLNVFDLKELMQKNAGFSLSMSKIMGDRLVQFQERIESLMFKDTHTRVIDLLKEFAKKQGQKIGDEVMIKHNLTHQDFASLTATTRQTVTSILNGLKKRDLIYMERGKMLIRDLGKLV